MQYLGGKHRLAKRIVAAIRARVGDVYMWEPFCGGLSVTVELAKGGGGLASDVHLPLISLYQACRAGWIPPEHVSEAQWRVARTLSDTDPLKAFAGFGHSFGGKWFGGYADKGPKRAGYDFTLCTTRALARQIPATAHWDFRHLSFFDVAPNAGQNVAIYCDPPYEGTTGYAMDFDHAAFWKRCQEWAQFCPVLVSEFVCPVPHRVLWSLERRINVQATTANVRTEHLFEVLLLK